jgi:nucleoside-diphosphate-sugar epimerase
LFAPPFERPIPRAAVEYLVTGATGFIGSHVAAQLRARGDEVRAVVRSPERASLLSSLGVGLYKGDVTDRESLRAPMRGVDGVFHVAGWYHIGLRDRATALAVNVDGTRNVLDMMGELSVSKGVYTSTLAVYSDTHGVLRDESYRFRGRWLTLYDESKWRAHYEVAEPMARAGLPLVTVLPGLVYGPGDSSPMHDLWMQYFRRGLRVMPRVTAYSFGHVEDTADAHLRAMDRGRLGECYNISGPPHTLLEAFDIAQRVTGGYRVRSGTLPRARFDFWRAYPGASVTESRPPPISGTTRRRPANSASPRVPWSPVYLPRSNTR